MEVNISNGVNFFLVGLTDSAVKESQQRIQAALKNKGYKIPVKEITVNIAPADIRKEGSAYDILLWQLEYWRLQNKFNSIKW